MVGGASLVDAGIDRACSRIGRAGFARRRQRVGPLSRSGPQLGSRRVSSEQSLSRSNRSGAIVLPCSPFRLRRVAVPSRRVVSQPAHRVSIRRAPE